MTGMGTLGTHSSLRGRICYIVDPKWNATGKPWLWRARFWGHRPEVDLALLAQGYHLVYMEGMSRDGLAICLISDTIPWSWGRKKEIPAKN
jgi:hypothetical protein